MMSFITLRKIEVNLAILTPKCNLKVILVSCDKKNQYFMLLYYYIPINDTTLELSVFWPSDTESRINELRFSESISLSFITKLTSVTCFCFDHT